MKFVVQQNTFKTGVVELKDHMYTRDKWNTIQVLPFYEYMISDALRKGRMHEKRSIQYAIDDEVTK